MSPVAGHVVKVSVGFPRPRGDEPLPVAGPRRGVDVFPAPAGMSLNHGGIEKPGRGFPRPRGDEPLTVEDAHAILEFSPPPRG